MKPLYVIVLLFFLSVVGCERKDTLFTLLDADDTGVTFTNFIDEDAENNVLEYGYFYNGGGVAAADFNNDGLVDLYFTGNMVANQLYINKGEMEFEEVGDKAGVGLNEGWKTGVSLVDINNDGWMDLYVCRSGAENPALRKNLLYVNDGGTSGGIPTFTEKAAEYGLDDPSYTTQAVFFDYDKDGDTDCFLLNHSVQDFAGFSQLLSQYRQQKNPAYGNKVLRNDGGRFVDATDSSGIVSNVLSFGLGVNVNDFNNDGWSDIYVANDYNENDYLYLNQKNGTFKEVIRQATGHVSLYSMGTDAADLNNDSWSDIITLDMLPATNDRIKLTAGDDNFDKYQQLLRAGFHDQTMRNMLQLNNGTNSEGVPQFSEVGQLAGISNTDWSWAVLMADFDNDGHKDVFVTNGYARDYTNMEFLKYSTDLQLSARSSGQSTEQMEIIANMPPINQPNFIFRNEGNLTFTKKTEDWGFATNSQSNGAIYADLDNDGDLDIVTNNVNDKAFIYQNNSAQADAAESISFALQAPTYALKVGARITLFQTDGTRQSQDFMPVRGFQSAMAGPVHFGLKRAKVDSATIQWTDGRVQVLRHPAANLVHPVKYDATSNMVLTERPFDPLFHEVTGPDFYQPEVPRNDFRIQPLLPYMLTFQGPAIAQSTRRGTTSVAVYIGGVRGKSGSLFIRENGTYQSLKIPAFEKDALFQDSDAQFFDADGDGDDDLLVSSAGYDLNPTDSLLRPRLYLYSGNTYVRAPFPDLRLNASSLAIADLDQDNDPDLFIGERVLPGRFPESRGGYLLLNDGKGGFSDQTSRLLPDHRSLGMVTKATFQDLDQDKTPELVLSTDWGPIQICQQDSRGVFRIANEKWGTSQLMGCWNTLEPADLDGDGDVDFVVGNTGTNWQWTVAAPGGLALYTDTTSGARPIPILSVTSDGKEYPYASRDELLDQLPVLKKKYTDYVSFSKATLADIYSASELGKMIPKKVTNLLSGILENTKGRLQFKPLPLQAQFSPVFAIGVADFDGDGKKDILLGGNQSMVRVRMGKNDANLVQVFVNEGTTNFSYLPQHRSGIYINGDVRSLAILNYTSPMEILIGRNNLSLKTLQIAKKR